MNRFPLTTLLLSALLAAPALVTAEDSMDSEIDYLLEAVSASGCAFIRNGKEHASESAVEHLQMKRKRGKRYYDSTEEFIEKIASSSSWSGKPYLISCNGEEPSPISEWYLAALADFRAR